MFVETKTDGEAQQIGRDDFIAWLRTKPADQSYDFLDSDHCAWGQYAASRGETPIAEIDRIARRLGLTHGQASDALQGFGVRDEWTFGALLQRMLALRAAP